MLRLLCILTLLTVLLPLTAAERGFVPARRAAADHVALVIGNGAYPDVPLSNPVNDAVDVAKAFESIGFQVQLVTDADKAQMLQAISGFGDRLAKAKAAVFYYAGHGVQVGGSNWLLPVARQVGEIINREDEVRLRAVDANEVLVAMERAKVPVAMVILDACRNNPFKGAGRSGAKGLAQLDAPPGSLVVYATAPGQVAADGTGRNSPFSQAFVSQLLVPGQEVEAMLRNVKKSVRETTQGVQVPWSSSSMTDTFTFVPAMTPDEEAAMKRAELAGLQGQAEAIAKAEATAAAKRQSEETALAAKQAEVDKLNAQIENIRKKMSAGGGAEPSAGHDADLDRMVAVVQRKEAQQKELVEMRRKAETARAAREADISKLKQQDYELMKTRQQERLKLLAVDLEKYQTVAASEFGKNLADQAWKSILQKWDVPTGSVRRDDIPYLQRVIAPLVFWEMFSMDAQRLLAATSRNRLLDSKSRNGPGTVLEMKQFVARWDPLWKDGPVKLDGIKVWDSNFPTSSPEHWIFEIYYRMTNFGPTAGPPEISSSIQAVIAECNPEEVGHLLGIRDKTPQTAFLSELCEKAYSKDSSRYAEYLNGLNWFSRLVAESENRQRAEASTDITSVFSVLLIVPGIVTLVVIGIFKFTIKSKNTAGGHDAQPPPAGA